MMPHGGLVSYRPKIGEGPRGPVYGDEVVPKRAAIDDSHKLVRTATSAEASSSARVALDLPEHQVPLGSTVTIWKGRGNEREATVIAVGTGDWPRLPRFTELALE
ncbi:hypothetical protein [Microbacterium sp. gxy059]|uniref:hypothetical protein n=1 Tax=Microbacterium sp. gxy059 TaxID=2957199 RepID=UPI003D988C37